jgi:folate-binding protein YgfZ
LDQILTQSLGDIAAGEARDAAMITVKGRMRFFFEIVARGESVLLTHLEPGLAASVQEELQRYVFATRVTIEDVSDTYALILILGEKWRELAERTGVDGLILHPTRSYGEDAGYVWAPSADHQLLLGKLAECGAQRISEDESESIRIAAGIPRWGFDMDESTFPQEAGIDGRAVHYTKGCYLGQEAMAKIHFRGKVNRRLARLVAEGPVEAGSEIQVQGQKVGVVTSASGVSALGYVKHTVEIGTEISVGDMKASVES